jgi:inner membrane protein
LPTVGHVAVGLAAARATSIPRGLAAWSWALLLSGLSLLPDTDFVGFHLGVPHGAPFGHRGALHSLVFALAVGLVVAALAVVLRLPVLRVWLASSLVLASHGVLDSLTSGRTGVALLWPFSLQRYFAPWRPIPVVPLGARLLTVHGVTLVMHEALLFLPLLVFGVWPRRKRSVGEGGLTTA